MMLTPEQREVLQECRSRVDDIVAHASDPLHLENHRRIIFAAMPVELRLFDERTPGASRIIPLDIDATGHP